MFNQQKNPSQLVLGSTVGLVFLLIAFACIRPTKSKLDEIAFPGSVTPPSGQKRLIVLLPGIRDTPRQFEQQGLIKDIKLFDTSADLLAVDSHIGYYLERSFVSHLKKDVIDPAKQNGYQDIWLVGISLGGYGALSYVLQRPDDVSKVFIMSPYLGHDGLINEIKESGGINKWQTPAFLLLDWRRKLWTWIKDFSIKQDIYPPVYLGLAKQDPFYESNLLFAEILPAERVFIVEGKHDWHSWRHMWQKFFQKEYPVAHH